MITIRSAHDQPGVLRVAVDRGRTRSFYDRISGVYDLLSGWSEAPARRRGFELLAPRRGERILEIGCGTGQLLPEIASAVEPTGHVYGLDLSERMLRRARARLLRYGLAERVGLYTGDATRLPYPDSTFDAIFTSFTLELFDTPEIPGVLAECRRVLRPGGRMVVVGITRTGAGNAIRRLYEWAHLRFPTLVDCRPIYVERALAAAGFLIQAAARVRGFLPVEVVRARRELRPVGQKIHLA